MSAPPLLDTNILVYAISSDQRAVRAQELLSQPFIVSVQALNELTNVAVRKLRLDIGEIRQILSDVRFLARDVVPVDETLHLRALDIVERYRLSFYDALMLAAACEHNCQICFSEDMQAGMEIDGVRIINPFV